MADVQLLFLPPLMKETLKQFVKRVLSSLGIHLTQNQRYDALAIKVMRKAIDQNANCVDVGCHKGEMLEAMLQLAPRGQHFAFEPIPELFELLKERYADRVAVHQIALSDRTGTTTFQHVVTNPAYSGIKKRTYKSDEAIEQIKVPTDRLDALIPDSIRIDFLKIDVEGGELQVLEGAREHIARSKPVIIFEHGIGASDHYGTTPEMIYTLLVEDCGLQIGLLEDYLADQSGLPAKEFARQYHEALNYYFVAYP